MPPVRSVMLRIPDSPGDQSSEVDHNDTLESVIVLFQVDTSLSYRAMKDIGSVGVHNMRKLLRALVPSEQPDDPERSRLGG